MRSRSRQTPVIENEDPVRRADARSSLRNDEDGHAAFQRVHRLAELQVRREIQRAGRIVHDENLRLLHQCAGDGQPLPLSAGEIASVLLDGRVEAAGFAVDHLGGLRGFRRRHQLLVRGVLIAPAEIVADRSLEQDCLLRHDADPAGEDPVGISGNRTAVDLHRSLRRVVEPRDQIRQRRLAAARAADDADGLTPPDREVKVRNRLAPGTRVGEGDVMERHRFRRPASTGSAGRLFRSGGGAAGCLSRGRVRIDHRRLHVEHALDPVRAGDRLVDRDDQRGKLHQLHDHLCHIVVERDHVALKKPAGLHAERPHPDQHDRGDIDQRVGRGVHQRGETADPLVHPGEGVVLRVKFRRLGLLLAERADHPDAGEILPRGTEEPVQRALSLREQRDARQHDPENHRAEHGDCHHEDQSAPHIDREGHHHRAEHNERAPEQKTERHVQPVLHLIDVAGHPRDQRVRPHRVQLRVGKPADMVKQSLTDLGGRPDAGASREPLGCERKQHARRGQREEDREAPDDIAAVLTGDAVVDDRGHHQRNQQVHQRLEHLERRCQHAVQPIVFQIFQEFPHRRSPFPGRSLRTRAVFLSYHTAGRRNSGTAVEKDRAAVGSAYKTRFRARSASRRNRRNKKRGRPPAASFHSLCLLSCLVFAGLRFSFLPRDGLRVPVKDHGLNLAAGL